MEYSRQTRPWFPTLVYHQLPRAARQGPSRRDRHQGWSDDHDPLVHQRSGTHGCLPQGLRRARSATHSMIPTNTVRHVCRAGIARAQGQARRLCDSCADDQCFAGGLSFTAARATSVEEINALMKGAAERGPLQGILAYADAPLVSVDYNHDPHSSVYDATMTKVIGGHWSRLAPGTTTNGVSRAVCLTRRWLGRAPRECATSMKLIRMADLDLSDRRVLIREDLNVPIRDML